MFNFELFTYTESPGQRNTWLRIGYLGRNLALPPGSIFLFCFLFVCLFCLKHGGWPPPPQKKDKNPLYSHGWSSFLSMPDFPSSDSWVLGRKYSYGPPWIFYCWGSNPEPLHCHIGARHGNALWVLSQADCEFLARLDHTVRLPFQWRWVRARREAGMWEAVILTL